MTDFLRGTPFQPREQCQNIFQIIETRTLLRCVRLGRELLNFVISAILPPRQGIEFGLSNNHLFVRPAHGDELADKWHLQLALRLHRFLGVRVLRKPMRERMKQSEVAVHILVLDQCATHDDLRNQNQRDDVGRSLRVGHQGGDDQTQRYATHRS